jgi:glucosamine--fructose-6-phosphate aminotransferase (isomerizing)
VCGILACALPRKTAALPFLREGLRRLEYRGYDSHGFVTLVGDGPGEAEFRRVVRVGAAGDYPAGGLDDYLTGSVGLAHTRWATHGGVSLRNCHPVGGGKTGTPGVHVVHNGVVDNWRELRRDLEGRGYRFVTDTDTEVIAHLLDQVFCEDRGEDFDPVRAVSEVLKGRFAFAAVFRHLPGRLMLVARGCPLVVSDNGHAASDPAALVGFARNFWRMPEGSQAWLFGGHLAASDLKNVDPIVPDFRERLPEAPVIPPSGGRTRSEMLSQSALLRAGPLTPPPPILAQAPEILLFGCGSSYHVALLGEYWLRREGRHARAVPAAEFDCLEPADAGSVGVAITQSGETADVLEAVRNSPWACVALTNVPHSAAARACQVCWDVGAGPEYGVAATKSFTLSAARLLEAAIPEAGDELASSLPDALDALGLLVRPQTIAALAAAPLSLILGRGPDWPVAREGALKFQELARTHTLALHAQELKHGPLALVAPGVAVLAIVPTRRDPGRNRVLAALEEAAARDAEVFVIGSADDPEARRLASHPDHFLALPDAHVTTTRPLLVAVLLQHLALGVAEYLGLDPDRPRNLAKCVSVS